MNLEKAITEIKEAFPGMEFHENEPMSNHCSFGTGGSVRAMAVPDGVVTLSKICYILKENKAAPFILGNGTNVVFPDEGNADLFIISTAKLQKVFLLDECSIYAESGVSLSRLAAFALENGLSGLEFASGIPGTVGGGVMMNAGAYGGELKDTIESVVSYYLPEQRMYELDNGQCDFRYRHSRYQDIPGNVILSAVFRLEKGDSAQISARMKELNERRREKQPLDLPSAGSTFRRPEGHYAAQLIEEAGLKGYRIGGAQVSEKHAGFLVNSGNATSTDLYNLMDYVRRTVYEKSGVELNPEVILIPPDYRLEDNGPRIPLHFEKPEGAEEQKES